MRDPLGIDAIDFDLYDDRRTPLSASDKRKDIEAEIRKKIQKQALGVRRKEQERTARAIESCLDRAALKTRERCSSLRIRTGVSLLAIGASVSNADHPNHVIIVEGKRVAPMKRRANDLYHHLLALTFRRMESAHVEL